MFAACQSGKLQCCEGSGSVKLIVPKVGIYVAMESKAPPSVPARRFTGSTLAGAAPPTAVLIEEFTAERANDAKKLFVAMGDLPAVPRHLRRRARSWRPFGLLRCRQAVMKDARVVRKKKPKSGPVAENDVGNRTVAAMAGEQDPITGIVRVRVRKHWRRPAILLKAHASLTPPLGGAVRKHLQTHMWHAKRAHMENLWGHRLAVHNCSLGTRALYRATSRHCCMHDRSYVELFELCGSETSILRVLNRCGIKAHLALAPVARSGARRIRALLYASDTAHLIAPVLILWCPAQCTKKAAAEEQSSEEEMLPFVMDVGGSGVQQIEMEKMERPTVPVEEGWKLWIWVHPSAADEAPQCLWPVRHLPNLARVFACLLPVTPLTSAGFCQPEIGSALSLRIFVLLFPFLATIRAAQAAEQVASSFDVGPRGAQADSFLRLDPGCTPQDCMCQRCSAAGGWGVVVLLVT